jgi:hypothetical protein
VNSRGAYRTGTLLMSVLLTMLGLGIITRTALAGGSGVAIGYIMGSAMVIVGGLRLWILRRG